MKTTRGNLCLGQAARRTLAALTASVALLLLAPSLASAYEVHISITGAGQVTETTQADLVGDTCQTSSTNPTGVVGVNCYPGSPSGDYGWGWDVDYVATAKPGYRFDRWVSDGSTDTGIVCSRSSPPATTTTYTGSTCKFNTYDNLQTRAVFIDDTNPAMASLTGPNGPVNGPASFYFSASADPTFRRFECRVAGVHDWQTCSSGHTENPPSGTYTLQVRAVDWSGNRSAESTWTWTVDKVLPHTTLDSGTGPAEGSTVSSSEASFQFSTNESGSFLCKLDAGSWQGCDSPRALPDLSDGPHTFSVKAVDQAGNEDDTPAERHWTVDTTPPDTQASGASGFTKDATPTFNFAGVPTTDAARFQCRVDGQAFGPCSGPGRSHTPPRLPDGAHTFQVRAIDAAGNVDPTPASRRVQIDTRPPETTITSGPSGKTTDRTPTFKFASSEAGSGFKCSLDGARYTSCTSPLTTARLSFGRHSFKVRAVDRARNSDPTPAVRSFKVVRRR